MLNLAAISDNAWKQVLGEIWPTQNILNLETFLEGELKKGKTIYPPQNEIFNAFSSCPYHDVKVIILGQDPYHNENQAHGLSFSVALTQKLPPSLKNIFKEITNDLEVPIRTEGNLSSWAAQGVLLLNAILTVNAHEAASHQKAGWENLTNAVISKLSEEKEHLVFILWGKFAQNKKVLIDEKKHLVLEAAHPSPLSAYNGFFNCRHFSKTNAYLMKHGKTAIDWTITQKVRIKL